jgi:sugar phosphate isomerase/epimerase
VPHRFGISTHLFHAERLDRPHLAEVAARGFESIEVYATRTHFDYHDPDTAKALAGWLADTGLTLDSVHAPTTMGYVNGTWGETVSIGAADEARRRLAMDEVKAAIALSSAVRFGTLVVHLGFPSLDPQVNNRSAVARSLEEILEATGAAGVRLAIELIPNPLSIASRLVQWVEDDLDDSTAGICLDVGHANLGGDVVEAIETCSGHVITTHLHDNRGKRDDHLLPGDGAIDWPATMLAFQKVGYDGVWILELSPSADWRAVLGRAQRARAKLEQLLDGDL